MQHIVAATDTEPIEAVSRAIDLAEDLHRTPGQIDDAHLGRRRPEPARTGARRIVAKTATGFARKPMYLGPWTGLLRSHLATMIGNFPTARIAEISDVDFPQAE